MRRGSRGATRSRASMEQLVAACTAAMESLRGLLTPEQMRDALIVCLRERHGCTLEQIGEVFGISAERVRQLYRRVTQPPARQARRRRAPIEELSRDASDALREAGLESNATLGDVSVLMPLLELSVTQPNHHRLNALFHVPHINRTILHEIEEWLARHGVVLER